MGAHSEAEEVREDAGAHDGGEPGGAKRWERWEGRGGARGGGLGGAHAFNYSPLATGPGWRSHMLGIASFGASRLAANAGP